MELLQVKLTGVWGIYYDGTYDANVSVYNNHTDSIGFWVQKGLELTDGKVSKSEVRRIVDLNAGATIDNRFDNLANNEIKLIAGSELLFDLKKDTLVPLIMSENEYNDARIRRIELSSEARIKRWSSMMGSLSSPDVLASYSKFAVLVEALKLYQVDYLEADNKIFECFINGLDHPWINNIPTYPRDVAFKTSSGIALKTLPLWDVPESDEDYKTLVVGIITGCIVNADHYIQ